MRNSFHVALLLAGSLAIGFLGCQSRDVATVQAGQLRVAFDNVVGNQDLTLNTRTYQNELGESFVVTKFNYYVSNIRLNKADGSAYVVPQDDSYFLIQEDKPVSQTISLGNVPVGEYTGISFVIGVDSARSLADISKRTGVLDPGLSTHEAMYWEWNSGYIFLKLEGTSVAAPALQNNSFVYHIGGFGYNGKINNLRTITLPFAGNNVTISPVATRQISLMADLLAIFNGSTKLSIAQHSSVMFEPYSTNIANNYVQMIRYVGQSAR